MGVGRARESERTCSPSCPRPRLVDLERESSPRRRPVRVRRRRSQRRAERGERSEGGKCDGLIGVEVRITPLSQAGSGRERPQTSTPIDRFSLRPSLATQRETSPPDKRQACVGALLSRCGEGWLGVSGGCSELGRRHPDMAPSEAQRAGHLKKPLKVPILGSPQKNWCDGVCPTSRKRSSYHVCATTAD